MAVITRLEWRTELQALSRDLNSGEWRGSAKVPTAVAAHSGVPLLRVATHRTRPRPINHDQNKYSMVHTKQYMPVSTPNNICQSKREGSGDDIVLTGIYCLVWTMLYEVRGCRKVGLRRRRDRAQKRLLKNVRRPESCKVARIIIFAGPSNHANWVPHQTLHRTASFESNISV